MPKDMTLTKFTKIKKDGLISMSKEMKLISTIVDVTDSEVYLFFRLGYTYNTIRSRRDSV